MTIHLARRDTEQVCGYSVACTAPNILQTLALETYRVDCQECQQTPLYKERQHEELYGPHADEHTAEKARRIAAGLVNYGSNP